MSYMKKELFLLRRMPMQCKNHSCVCRWGCRIKDMAEYCILHKKFCALYRGDSKGEESAVVDNSNDTKVNTIETTEDSDE